MKIFIDPQIAVMVLKVITDTIITKYCDIVLSGTKDFERNNM